MATCWDASPFSLGAHQFQSAQRLAILLPRKSLSGYTERPPRPKGVKGRRPDDKLTSEAKALDDRGQQQWLVGQPFAGWPEKARLSPRSREVRRITVWKKRFLDVSQLICSRKNERSIFTVSPRFGIRSCVEENANDTAESRPVVRVRRFGYGVDRVAQRSGAESIMKIDRASVGKKSQHKRDVPVLRRHMQCGTRGAGGNPRRHHAGMKEFQNTTFVPTAGRFEQVRCPTKFKNGH